MKNTLFILRIFVFSLLVLPIVSCSDDDDGNGDNGGGDAQNIVEIALETDELAILVQALQAADGDLVNVLQGPGPFTVLAPTNAAFTAFLASNGFGSLEEVPTDVLAEILLNHVIAADIKSTDLASAGRGYASTSATGAGGNNISIYFNATAGVRFNNVSAVTDGGADIEASNGTIHIVDAVIPLPTIASHAAANSTDFSSLVAALGAADGDLIGDLTGEGPFTVLAPDNAAFSEFLGDTPLGNVNTAVLRRILLNHVLDAELGAVSSTELGALGNGYVNTSVTGAGDNPMSLYFDTDGGVEFNGISTVTEADIVGTNGIIHAVDAVIDLPTIVTFALADPSFSTLVDALTDLTPGVDYVNILSRTEGSNADGINPDYTVFAPTDEAFAALIDELGGVPEATVLATVLNHHVITEANIASGDLMMGANTVTTLQGEDITVTLPGTGNNIADVTDGAGNTDIGIIFVDVQAENGVIHVVNKVMLPNL